MFSRGNLSLKYKLYQNSIKTLKEKLLNLNRTCDKPASTSIKYGEILNTLKVENNSICNISTIQKHRQSLILIQTNLLQKRNEVADDLSKSKQIRYLKKFFKHPTVFTAAGLSIFSKDVVSMTEPGIIIEPIPEPPAIPDVAADFHPELNKLGEATFASLDLGGWTPVGIVQNCFEFLHVTAGLPWWGAIAVATLVIRLCMFPLVIITQRNAAKMNNVMPQMQVLQLKMTEARQCGNQLEVAKLSNELLVFMKEKGVNPFKNMVVPLVQMPIFISFFMGLREMANVPVDSLKTGGLYWFTDLTVPDQFYIMPIITSLTLWATVELGADSAKLSSQNMMVMKYVLRALPIIIFPFTINFPGALLCYWVSSNFISLAQVGFLRIPKVRTYFKIDPIIKFDPKNLPIQSKGFIGGIKDSWTNIKITRDLEDRKRLDDLQFQRAGKGPMVKTFKYDPTKFAKAPISTKSR